MSKTSAMVFHPLLQLYCVFLYNTCVERVQSFSQPWNLVLTILVQEWGKMMITVLNKLASKHLTRFFSEFSYICSVCWSNISLLYYLVVYNCFFVESCQAKRHRHDIILRAVWKSGTWVIAGSFFERGGKKKAFGCQCHFAWRLSKKTQLYTTYFFVVLSSLSFSFSFPFILAFFQPHPQRLMQT